MFPQGQALQASLATLLVLSPVVEEIVFRAGLQEALVRRAGTDSAARRSWLANAITALAFATAHLVLRPGITSALTLLPALACGHVYARRRQVLPCIALHALFNAAWLLGAPRLA